MILTLILAAAVAFACAAVRHHLEHTEQKETNYLDGRVVRTALYNRGSAFGLLPLGRCALAVVSAAVMVLSLPLWRRSRLGCALLLGGGASNLYERLSGRGVFDYIQFPKAPGRLKKYVFNLADFAIFLGAVCISLTSGGKHR